MENIKPEELQALVERIINSGDLGRSRTYASILNYLVECSISGINPKEIAIAIDVLGRNADFDVAKDSVVRVHIYHLRNKLKVYFSKSGKNEKYRIDIPKGQYVIAAELNDGIQEDSGIRSVTGKQLDRRPLTPWLMMVAFIILSGNLYLELEVETEAVEIVNTAYPRLWQAILDDDTPVILVVGDYYIFGELDEVGNVSRLVREFDINSQEDLEIEQGFDSAKAQSYFNLDLSYIPTSAAFAVSQIVPVFSDNAERVKVKMMSELSTADLVDNHIVYLGYLSGLSNLEDLLFASSDLSVGASYDELYNLKTDEYFYSSSGLSMGENSYQDYGLLSTFPTPSGNQFVFIAGMRDEGLTNVVQEVSNFAQLMDLEAGLETTQRITEGVAYEALYGVVGFDGTNFDANRVYSNVLDTEVIWEAKLISH